MVAYRRRAIILATLAGAAAGRATTIATPHVRPRLFEPSLSPDDHVDTPGLRFDRAADEGGRGLAVVRALLGQLGATPPKPE